MLKVEAEGEGRLAQLLDLIYLGDWTSYYLALDNDVDPGPIDAIMQLKAAHRLTAPPIVRVASTVCGASTRIVQRAWAGSEVRGAPG